MNNVFCECIAKTENILTENIFEKGQVTFGILIRFPKENSYILVGYLYSYVNIKNYEIRAALLFCSEYMYDFTEKNKNK